VNTKQAAEHTLMGTVKFHGVVQLNVKRLLSSTWVNYSATIMEDGIMTLCNVRVFKITKK